MGTRVRSYAKINLGLAIGGVRADGFHGLRTLYQTLRLHDYVTVTAKRADVTRIRLSSNEPRVPLDGRNTVWKMVEKTLKHLSVCAEVEVHLEKKLPIQGGMGAGSANAAAALIGLERELSVKMPMTVKLGLAGEVGSDVPLFLVGGSVLGSDRGQVVEGVPDVTLGGAAEIACVIALPGVGVSTPSAFREWDRKRGLQETAEGDTIEELSRTYAAVFSLGKAESDVGASGIKLQPVSVQRVIAEQNSPEKLHGRSREQLHTSLTTDDSGRDTSGFEIGLAENSLLALVRTGIENAFEEVVFMQHPPLREIKRQLMGNVSDGNPAVYAALSGSGSALFGLYGSTADAQAAQQRLQGQAVQAIVTTTMPRAQYWSEMFAE